MAGPADKGEAVPSPLRGPRVGATPLGRPRSFEANALVHGDSIRARASPPRWARSFAGHAKGEAVPRIAGYARSGTNVFARQCLGHSWPPRGVHARDNQIARQGLAPTRSGQKLHVSQRVGATHWVALGHSCQRARSWPGQTIREAVPRNGGRRGASPDKGEAVPRPYAVRPNDVSQRRGDPLGRPRSFMPRPYLLGVCSDSDFRGSVTIIVAYSPSSDSTLIEPPCSRTMSLEIANPSPVP